jgi:hypothetical protein
MRTDALDRVRWERLATFTGGRDLEVEDLKREVDEVFGEPQLISATGSVLQGYGNADSDIDVYVVVPARVTAFPITSYKSRARIDLCYHSEGELRRRIELLRDEPWPRGDANRTAWLAQHRALDDVTRFALGVALHAETAWDETLCDLRRPWLAEQVVTWWEVEAYRRWVACEWLRDEKPFLAAQRAFEAVWLALESRNARDGHFYFTPKWSSLKLADRDDWRGLALLEHGLEFPLDETECGLFIDQQRDALEEILGRPPEESRGYQLQLWLAPGAEVWKVARSTVVARWAMRGVELPETSLMLADEGAGLVAAVDDPRSISPLHKQLFREDMLWLGVAEAAL